MANSEFKVNTGPALAGLKDLITQIRQAGSNLDKLGATAEKTMTSASKSFEKQTQSLEKQINVSNNLGRQNKATAATLDDMARSAKDSFAVLSQNFQTAAHTARVFQKGQEELRALLLKTDHYNEIVRHHRTMAIMQEKSGNKARELAHAVDLLTTAEGKGLAQAKVYNSESQKRASAEARQTEQLKTKQQTLQLLNSEEGRANVALSERIRSEKAIIASAERLKTQERELLAQKKLNTSEDHRKVQALKATIAAQKLQDQAAQKATLATEKQKIATADLRRELQFLNSKEGKAQVRLRQQVADTRREIARSAKTQEEKNKKVRIGNQLTTALRAGLHGAQTSIGMYTSSTIAAAIATFSLARAIRSTMTVGIEFTATMARTNAIMDSSSSMFAAAELQVRSLGQTTQYTASQVATGMTELGQAGLSAGQSMIALKPALDLSTVGNISLAQSADHATNIMSAFGLQAENLTHIVNVLAQATTTSNTTIDQLANALTYAGPAADAAGYALEDTVAAIDTMANSGIKSSKAGTALRRLFVSLVNPTEKGKKVLDEYGISVRNLDGSFKSLQNVMNQFDAAFAGKENERLAAIQDLVGVYATSPIATLMKNNETFNAHIAQFDLMGDAAGRMKEKINDSLKFDVNQVKSAFQDLQLNVFKDNEMQFRVWAQSVTDFLQYLGTAGESGKTVLEEFAVTVKDTAYVVGWLALTMKGVSLWSKHWGPVISAISSARASVSNMGTVLTTTAASGTRSLSTLALAAGALDVKMKKAAGSTTALAGSASAVGVLAGGVGKATASVVRFLGPVGLAVSTGYLLYEAYSTIFGDRSDVMKGMEDSEQLFINRFEAAQEETAQVKKLREEYDKLAKHNKARNEASTAANLKIQASQSGQALIEVNKKIALAEQLLEEETNEVRRQAHLSRIALLKSDRDQLTATIHHIGTEYKKLEGNLSEIQVLQAEVNKLFDEYGNKDGGRGIQAVIGRLQELHAEIDRLKSIGSVDVGGMLHLNQAREYDARGMAKANIGFGTDQLSLPDKFSKVSEAYQEAAKNFDDVTRRAEKTQADSFRDEKDMADQLERAAKNKVAAYETLISLIADINVQQASLVSAQAAYDFSLMDNAEKQNHLLERKLELEQRIAGYADRNDPAESGAHAKDLRDLTSVDSQLKAFEKTTRSVGRAAKDNMSVFTSLYQQYDKVGYSADQLAQTQKDLAGLLNKGRIDQIQYNMALAEAEKAHAKVALQENKRYQLLKDLSSTYLSTDNDQRVADLTRLRENTALLTEEERKLFEQRIMSSATSNITTPNLALQGASQGPFSGFINTASNVADGNRELGDAGVGIAERQRDSLLAEQLEYRRKMESEDREIRLQAEQDFANKAKSINDIAFAESQQLAQSKLQFQKQASTMMMASMAESMSSVLGMVAATGEDATAAQKVAFAAQKALAIASILIYTHMAAAKAAADPSNPTIFGSMALSTAIMAQGYASAGLVAGMAIGELAGGGSSGGGGGGNYSGAYDDGGYIPAGKFGLVGEIGPEIVNGPANVTSRKETAALLKNGGGGGNSGDVSIHNEIHIHHESSGSTDAEQDGKMMGNAVKMVVMETLQKELRPNGMLYRRQ